MEQVKVQRVDYHLGQVGISKEGCGMEKDAVLEAIIVRQHGKLQQFIEDRLQKQSRLLDMTLKSHCEQIKLLISNADWKTSSAALQCGAPGACAPSSKHDAGAVDTAEFTAHQEHVRQIGIENDNSEGFAVEELEDAVREVEGDGEELVIRGTEHGNSRHNNSVSLSASGVCNDGDTGSVDYQSQIPEDAKEITSLNTIELKQLLDKTFSELEELRHQNDELIAHQKSPWTKSEPIHENHQAEATVRSPQEILDAVAKRLLTRELLPSLLCPITRAVMRDPVSAPDGNTYERSAIERYMQRSGDMVVSPLTRKPFQSKQLIPNNAIRRLIAKEGRLLPPFESASATVVVTALPQTSGSRVVKWVV